MGLLLEAVDVEGPLTWRWLLREAETGNPLADQPVRIDRESDDVVRFRDLYAYLDEYAAPDRWTEDGTRFVDLAGKWAGRDLLGAALGAAILDEAPVTVRVQVPVELDEVLLALEGLVEDLQVDPGVCVHVVSGLEEFYMGAGGG